MSYNWKEAEFEIERKSKLINQLQEENARMMDFIVSLSKCTTQHHEISGQYGGTEEIDFIDDCWKERARVLISEIKGE